LTRAQDSSAENRSLSGLPKKDVRNECELFEPRKTVERETTTAAVDAKDPRSAFDQLFKK